MSLKLEEVVGKSLTEEQFDEAAGKKDKCYHKVKARYDVWPSAYASGALVKCRKVGAANWGNKSKKEGVNEDIDSQIKSMMDRREKMKKRGASTSSINSVTQMIKRLRDKKRKMNEKRGTCWVGYQQVGMKKKNVRWCLIVLRKLQKYFGKRMEKVMDIHLNIS